MATKFETTECSRCGGSGRYSYCAMYGDTCFKCSGSGRMHTKRGAEARAIFLASLERTYGEVEVGWRVLVSGRGWRTVTEVKLNPGGGHYVNYGTPDEKLIPNTHAIVTSAVVMVGMADSKVTGYSSRDDYERLLAEALAHQSV